MSKKVGELVPGDVLCDMHDGLRNLRVDGKVVSQSIISIPSKHGSRFIKDTLLQSVDACRVTYTSKLLVVIDVDGNTVTAAYSYDASWFGLVKIVFE